MFKTPCCKVEVPWLKAISSRPMAPVKCSNCGTKYHDEADRKHRRLMLWIMFVAFIFLFAGLVLGLRKMFYIGGFLSVISLTLIAYDEFLVVKAGVLTMTTLQKQKSDLKIIILSLAVILVEILYEVYRAL
jgi:predicted nucleic acid-binding Zn ribbon protein